MPSLKFQGCDYSGEIEILDYRGDILKRKNVSDTSMCFTAVYFLAAFN